MNYSAFEKLQAEFPTLTVFQIQRILKSRPEASWKSDAQALQDRWPWEYLCLEADFGPIALTIEPPLLIPRQDTWDWLEQAFRAIGDKGQILDLGCGPGTLGLGWLALQNKPFHLTAIDCHPVAIRVASQNFEKSALLDWKCYLSNWFESIPVQTFELILSNPPYCDLNTQAFSDSSQEDPNARFAAMGGLEPYIKIFEKATQYMGKNSDLVVEHGADQGIALSNIGTSCGLKQVGIYHDSQGHWRASHFKNSHNP